MTKKIKNWKNKLKIIFFSNCGQNSKQRSKKKRWILNKHIFSVTRRAGCLIPACRMIRCQEKLEKPSRRHIGEAKLFKLKFEDRSSVQISILFYFRIELVTKHMPYGRIFRPIGFIDDKNWDKDRHPKAKKWQKKWKIEKFLKIIFLPNFGQNSK